MYLNKTGTFGISSAAYWWGRLAAAMRRSGLLLLGPLSPLWALLFADAFNLTADGREYARSILMFVWWLVVLGVPISWHKTRGGLRYTWVGHELCLKEWPLGISESRAQWTIDRLSRTILAQHVDLKELQEALGRMVYVYGALSYDKPLMAPCLRS